MVGVSVIVTTYNRPDALAAVLAGLAAQRDARFDIIVADDGSTGETGALVDRFASQAPCAVQHVWQEDAGFRAAAIRNKAIAAAAGDYVIFLDGDCIPRPDFVAAHLRLAERGWFVAGNRLLLSRDFTRRALAAGMALSQWPLPHWCYARARGWVNRLLPLVTLPDGRLRKRRARDWRGVRTCNLGVWRADLQRVGGFDERYTGWGHEDADLAVRLIRAGVLHKDGRFATGVLHLWHGENDRSRLHANEDRLAQVLRSDRIRAP